MPNEPQTTHATLTDIVAAQRRWRDAARSLAKRRGQMAHDVIESIETALVDLGPAIGIDRAAAELIRISQTEQPATAQRTAQTTDPAITAAKVSATETTRSVDSAVESARRIPTLGERLEMSRRSVQDYWSSSKTKRS